MADARAAAAAEGREPLAEEEVDEHGASGTDGEAEEVPGGAEEEADPPLDEEEQAALDAQVRFDRVSRASMHVHGRPLLSA